MDDALAMDVDEGLPAPTKAANQLRTLTENALEANKVHQYALTKHAERLMAEMQELDKLMSEVTTEDIEDDTDAEIYIPGAIKAVGPCHVAEFLNPVRVSLKSPFYEDASRRSRYLTDTVDHPMKNKELDALAEAVRQENLRLKAYAAQQSGGSDTEFDVENNTEGINWAIVAENVSKTAGSTSRTADQCRIKWLGDRHPKINHGNWTPAELEKLKGLVSAQGEAKDVKVDWVQVANELGTNRTPIDCMRRGVPRQRHIWNGEADQRLTDAVKLYGTYNWNIVARYVSEDATATQCQVRYARAIDPTRKRGAWTDEEFARLAIAVGAYGTAWVEIAACMPGRSNEQCRERWSEHLGAASAHTVWSEEDDRALVAAVGELGNKWKEISVRVANGTTGQQCRSRWEKMKRLLEQQQAAAAAAAAATGESTAGPSTLAPQPQPPAQKPKPKARSRKNVNAPAQAEGGSTTPVPSAHPKPRPIKGKGKGKEKADEPELADDATSPAVGSDDTTPAAAGTKRAPEDADDAGDAPTKKKRRTTKGRLAGEAPAKKRGRPRKSIAASSSTAATTTTADPSNDENPQTEPSTTGTPVVTPPARPKPRRIKQAVTPTEFADPADVQQQPQPQPDPDTPRRVGLRPRKALLSPAEEAMGFHSEDGDAEPGTRTPRGRARGRGRGRGRGRAKVTAAAGREEGEAAGNNDPGADMPVDTDIVMAQAQAP
ncbi:hypothetical protein DXG01_010555 [Tephrocybe rancida]|nr:hypothetical protein DXG01_010555 [Tephrocybe rancida]